MNSHTEVLKLINIKICKYAREKTSEKSENDVKK